MLGTGNLPLVLVCLTYTVAEECGLCQEDILEICYDDPDKIQNNPYCLGCKKTKFYEVHRKI